MKGYRLPVLIRIIFLSIFAVSIFSSVKLLACQCAGQKPYEVEEAFEKANMVLHGRVTQMKEIKLADGDVIGVNFQINRAFKGEKEYLGKWQNEIEVIMPARSENCRVEAFRVRDYFTIFAVEREGVHKLYTDLCWGNRPVRSDGTSADLDWLLMRTAGEPKRIEMEPELEAVDLEPATSESTSLDP